MKNLLLLGLIFLSVVFGVKAQKLRVKKISFDYLRLPLVPAPEGVVNYNTEVVLSYEDQVIADKKVMQDKIDDVKSRNRELIDAQNNKSFGQKLGEQKMLGTRGVQNLESVPVDNNYYPVIHDKSGLASRIKIEGMTKGSENALNIKSTLSGFSYEKNEKSRKGAVKGADGNLKDVILYSYQVRYKHPLVISISAPNGEVLYEKVIEGSDSYTSRLTSEFESAAELHKYWKTNRNNFLNESDKGIVSRNFKKADEDINNILGKILQSLSIEVYTAAGKYDYSSYSEAYEKAMLGYKLLAYPESYDEALVNIKEAIAIWEVGVKEIDPSNKKAMINKKIGAGLEYNLLHAYLWINDFSNSKRYLTKCLVSGVSKLEKEAKKAEPIILDQEARYNANN